MLKQRVCHKKTASNKFDAATQLEILTCIY